MRALIILLISLAAGHTYAQNGSVILDLPASVPIGETVTGTFTINLSTNESPGQVIAVETGNPGYPITSATLSSANGSIEPFDLSDPIGVWTVTTGTFLAGTTYIVTFTIQANGPTTPFSPLAKFGELVATANVALPVTLASFNVVKEGDIAQLNWITSEETNSSHFDVQHSLNSKNWVTIGNVTTSKNSNTELNYFFEHSTPSNGENYYRLKMVDLDGSYSFSRIRNVSFTNITSELLTLYPNPVSNKLFVRNGTNIETINVYNKLGQAVISGDSSDLTTGLDVKSIPLGIYIVKIIQKDGKLSTHKIAIAK